MDRRSLANSVRRRVSLLLNETHNSLFSYLLYVAANYYPKAYLMYPGKQLLISSGKVPFFLAAALVGLGAAPLWTAKCTYLTDTGSIYAEVKHVHKDVIVNRFFGIFFMFFQSGLYH